MFLQTITFHSKLHMLHPNIIRLSEVDSTNNYAIHLLANSKPIEGTLIVAETQSKGRGTESNTWESEPGKNLTFSLILYPPINADKQFFLNKALSLGIHDFLKHALPQNQISIKWPNDIYIEDKKICGILIQNSVSGNNFEYLIAGIGLNVNQQIFLSDAPNPVSMTQLTGCEYSLPEILNSLFQHIAMRYNQVCEEKYNEIEDDYHKVLYQINKLNTYNYQEETVEAIIRGTNEYGQLLLDTANNRRLVCNFKEITFKI
jgi:BirA family biotin operon repressor/biotin-[acetyl-CoA-carboxylase] ligase